MKEKPLIILTGPTAVGKTALSINLAKTVGGEIISADSMQVYKYMDIGTAKIKQEEMEGIPHYLVDVLEPDEDFNVAVFQRMAKKALEKIYSHGHIPIVVGGTGFYIQALLYDIDFSEEPEDGRYRKLLEEEAKRDGVQVLHERLEKVDEASAASIHPNNVKRVIRALEYYHIHGSPISAHNEHERKKDSPYQFLYYVLDNERPVLYDRINTRVDKMIEEGLTDEVKSLLDRGYDKNLVSMQGLGYKEIIPYLHEEQSLEEAVYVLKRDTRHFAKRQLTWFKRERNVRWIKKNEFSKEEEILRFLCREIEEEFS